MNSSDNYFMKKTINKHLLVIATLLFIIPIQLFSLSLYKDNVIVSYYAEDFHGKRTSNGENFNMYDYTCAHKSLPFNTILKVTNLANGKSVEVRVNDRGPFVYNRELDLSKAAAIKLDMIKSGTTKAKIEIVKMGPDTKISRDTAAAVEKIMRDRGQLESQQEQSVKHGEAVKNPTTKVYEEGTFWDIQVGSFSKRENANKVAQDLLHKGFKDVVFQKTSSVYRVVIRKVPAEQVSNMEKKLHANGYNSLLIRQRFE